MYKHIVGLSLIDICRPYLRKQLLQTLNPLEYMFLNTFLINAVLIMYFSYIFVNQKQIIDSAVIQYNRLSVKQLCSISFSSVSTVASTIMLLDLDKKYNTPALNNIIIKSSSIVAVFFIGYFFFQETYSIKQIVGIVTMVSGFCIIIY
jgi:uncharacterized membrane protein